MSQRTIHETDAPEGTRVPVRAAGPGYRPDIDGLRAVAVLAVVFYHYGIGPLAGGFVGVDIFFVISGFLITGIVQKEIEQGRFTFAGFYQRRVRRLFPALFVVLLATLLAGLVILLPTDLALLGRTMVATVLFASNLFFWRNSGYFDGSSDNNPLLHTWSLAVEEQFYIVFPVFLLLVHRYIRGLRTLVLWLGTVGSFLLCVWMQHDRPDATFYLSPFRAWELSLGALLAVGALPLASRRWQRECLAALGAVLIGYAVLFIQPNEQFPGWRAALPVLGAAMIIQAGIAGDSLVKRMLSTGPMVFVGLISYSLYLWHWPLQVFANFLDQFHGLGQMRWLLFVLAMLLASASYYLVEKPFRHPRRTQNRKALFMVAGALSCVLLAAGMAMVQSNGLPARLPAQVVALDRERTPEIPFVDCMDREIADAGFQNLCRFGATGVQPTVLFWGDSHSLAWAPAIDDVLAKRGMAAIFAGGSACAPLVGIINPSAVPCRDRNKAVMDELTGSPGISTVILVASWSSYSNPDGRYRLQDDAGNQGNLAVFPRALRNTVAMLRANGKRVWLIGPTPRAPGDIPLLMAIAEQRDGKQPAQIPAQEYTRRMAAFYRVAEALPTDPGLLLSNPGPWLCDASLCRYALDGMPLYRDDGHLNVRGARYLSPMLERAFDQFQLMAVSAADGHERVPAQH